MFKLDENKNIVIDPNDLIVSSLNKLWERDKTKNKEVYIKEAKYIYLLCDYKSFYSNYRELERKEAAGLDVFNNKNFTPDKDLQEVIDLYNKVKKTVIIHLLDSAQEAIYILSDRLRSDKSKSKELTDSIGKIKEVMINFDSLRQAAEKELTSSSLTTKNNTKRGSREVPKDNTSKW